MRILINSLSAANQFASVEELALAVEQINACFELLLPQLDVGKIELLYDYSIESRGLLADCDNLQQSLSRIGNQDERTRWYYYTRNRACEAHSDMEMITLRSQAGELSGESTRSFLIEQFTLGFGGSAACQAEAFDVYAVADCGRAENRIKSSFDIEGIWKLLPRYVASPKHRSETYIREGGELVAAMALDDATAQICLLQALERGGHMYGRSGGKFYKFMLTACTPTGEIYHGFEVDRGEVPAELVGILDARIASD